MKKADKEAVSAKAELNAISMSAELATKEYNVALSKVREDWDDELEASETTTLRSETKFEKAR